jgi:hypothetical protein
VRKQQCFLVFITIKTQQNLAVLNSAVCTVIEQAQKSHVRIVLFKVLVELSLPQSTLEHELGRRRRRVHGRWGNHAVLLGLLRRLRRLQRNMPGDNGRLLHVAGSCVSYVYLSFILRCLVFIETNILILNDHTVRKASCRDDRARTYNVASACV